LLSNFRPITRECVHLGMRSHASGHVTKWRSHTIRSVIAKYPVYAQTLRLYLLQNRNHCHSKFYITGIGIFNRFCSGDLKLDPMTLINELDPYSLELYRMCKYELPTSRLSIVIVWQTDRQTDKQRHDRDDILLHFASGQICYVSCTLLS